MKKTKTIAFTALLTALYFVLSALLRIPVTEHLAPAIKIPTGLDHGFSGDDPVWPAAFAYAKKNRIPDPVI